MKKKQIPNVIRGKTAFMQAHRAGLASGDFSDFKTPGETAAPQATTPPLTENQTPQSANAAITKTLGNFRAPKDEKTVHHCWNCLYSTAIVMMLLLMVYAILRALI